MPSVHQHDPSPYQYPYPPISSTKGKPSPYVPVSTPTSTTSPYIPKATEQTRMLARTPSPTPSEERALKASVLDWKTLRKWRFWIRREWLWYYVALVVILVVTALVSIYHKQIVHWLTPVTRWLHDLSFGWLVPIGVLFVISFPPLFGHEIVAILCGLVWGLWIGFGIVSAGTFLGEVGNFYAFKYCCRSRGEKLERTNITYACLAKVVRDGGFKIALIARLSAIPGHFTTAVFSTCGMGIIVFSLAAILSMPKQFITVYLGVILEQSSTGVKDKKSTIISDVVLGITFVITIIAMWYIFRQMNKVKAEVIHERRKARQGKLARAGFSPYTNIEEASSSTVAFDPYSPDADTIPLKVQTPSVTSHPVSQDDSTLNDHHRYDNDPDPHYLYAPQPRKGQRLPLPNPVEDVGVEVYRYGNANAKNAKNASGSRSGSEDGSSINIQGHGSARSSTEDVGWDSRQPMRHASPEDMYGYRVSVGHEANLSSETVLDASQHGLQPMAPSSFSSLNETLQPRGVVPGPGTGTGAGTGAGHASYAYTLPPLPPSGALYPGHLEEDADMYRVPYGYGHGHGQEPTDASYKTARESSTDDDSDGAYSSQQAGRISSPPPPSYRT